MNDKTLDRTYKGAFDTGWILYRGFKTMVRVAVHGRSMHCIGVILGHISTMALRRNSSTTRCGQCRCMIARPQFPQVLESVSSRVGLARWVRESEKVLLRLEDAAI